MKNKYSIEVFLLSEHNDQANTENEEQNSTRQNDALVEEDHKTSIPLEKPLPFSIIPLS